VFLSRFLKSENPAIKQVQRQLNIKSNADFKRTMLELLNEYDYKYVKKNITDYDMDKIISKKILYHLNTFFTPYKRSVMEQIVVLNDPAPTTFGAPSRRLKHPANKRNKASSKSKTRKLRT
jgi:hypothetical protein